MNWKALAVGFVVVLATAVAGVLSGVWLLLFSGLGGGVVAGYLAGRIRTGLLHGVVLGLLVTALGVALGWWALSTPDVRVYPGAGMMLVFWWAISVLLGVEVVVGSLVGGGLRRLQRR